MTTPNALTGFKLRAAVDWIWVSVTLHRASQFRHVQSRMKKQFGKTYVKACDGNASSREFWFKVQNPVGADQFMDDVQCLVRPGDPAITEANIKIIGIELALDAYVRGSDRTALALATLYLLRHQALLPAGAARVTEPKHYRVPSTPRDAIQALMAGWSINAGPLGSDYTVRGYIKDYDSVAGKLYGVLPTDQHRAHFEITLAGALVPFTTIDGWRNFRFETMSKRFAMCVPTATDRLVIEMQDHLVQLGRGPDSPKRRPSDRRQRSPYTRRDSAFNDKIRQALRGLTGAQACRNSVTRKPVESTSPLGATTAAPATPKYLGFSTKNGLCAQRVPPAHAQQSPLTPPPPQQRRTNHHDPPAPTLKPIA